MVYNVITEAMLMYNFPQRERRKVMKKILSIIMTFGDRIC